MTSSVDEPRVTLVSLIPTDGRWRTMGRVLTATSVNLFVDGESVELSVWNVFDVIMTVRTSTDLFEHYCACLQEVLRHNVQLGCHVDRYHYAHHNRHVGRRDGSIWTSSHRMTLYAVKSLLYDESTRYAFESRYYTLARFFFFSSLKFTLFVTPQSNKFYLKKHQISNQINRLISTGCSYVVCNIINSKILVVDTHVQHFAIISHTSI